MRRRTARAKLTVEIKDWMGGWKKIWLRLFVACVGTVSSVFEACYCIPIIALSIDENLNYKL